MTARKSKKQKLVLLDAHAIIHRAYHALPDFTSSNGEPTGALYGLVAMLIKIVNDLKPDYMIAAYDLPEPTERHKAFSEYKAGREGPDEMLIHQLQRSRDVFAALNIPIYDKGGFEADDIIGTIVEKTKNNNNLDVVIASGDMDTLQLIDGDRVSVYTLRKGIRDTVVYNERAVKERFGFDSDLLPDYKGLRGDPSDNIPGIPGIGEKIATQLIATFGSIENIYKTLSEKPSLFEKKDIKPRVVKLLREHEDEARFSKELAEIRRDTPINFSLPKQEWLPSVDADRVLSLFAELGFRTLSVRIKELFGVENHTKQEEKKEENATDEEIAQTGIALWVLSSEHTNPTREDILSYTKTDTIKKAHEYLLKELTKQNLKSVYEDIELPLIPVLARMMDRGIRVDIEYLKKLSKTYRKKLEKLAREVYKHSGTEFNINSPQQLAGVLYTTLGLKGSARTATGQRSTRESELQKLIGIHPIIDSILSYRELQKLLSTYIDTIPALVSPKDGRLHAEFLQTGTTTGRLSSRNPNLQNIPIRTDLGRAVRGAFVAEEGYVLASIDYSQIELRVSAAITGDTKMRDVFVRGGDIHTEVAREVFGSSDAEARRKAKIINFGIHYGMGVNALARAIGAPRKDAQLFLESYFERFPGIAKHIETTKQFVHKNGYTETLFGRRRYFPGIQSHLPYVRAEAERMAINAPIQGTSADIIKIAMSRVDAFLDDKKIRDKVHLVLQIHDELVYEIHHDGAQKLGRELKTIMESVVPESKLGGVPLIADVSVGANWGEMSKLF